MMDGLKWIRDQPITINLCISKSELFFGYVIRIGGIRPLSQITIVPGTSSYTTGFTTTVIETCSGYVNNIISKKYYMCMTHTDCSQCFSCWVRSFDLWPHSPCLRFLLWFTSTSSPWASVSSTQWCSAHSLESEVRERGPMNGTDFDWQLLCFHSHSDFLISVVFNFTLNDKRKSPVWNVIMWTCLFIGQGVHVCLYCLEWYAQIHCPRTGVRITLELDTLLSNKAPENILKTGQ